MNLAKSIKIVITLFCFLFFSVTIFATDDYPVLSKIVTDNAHIFTSTEAKDLREKLKLFEANTKNQLVVLTINKLNGESIESYALEVFNRNELGQKKIDNGILILFVNADKKVRIEVGYGLEGILTDVTSSRIIHEIMIPEFKKNHYYEGINLATDKIIKLINNSTVREDYNENSKLPLLAIFIFGFIFVFFLSLISAAIYIGRRSIINIYKKSTKAYKGLLTGNIGLFYFPIILLVTILQQLLISILIVGILSAIPIFYFAITQDWPSPDLNSKYISTSLLSLGLLFFALLPITLAITQIIKSNKLHFSLSLKSNQSFMEKNFQSHDSSSSNKDDSDDNTNDHFSGRGGSSGGGGSSGSW